jgi:arylsulfatase A-like enzyme
VSHAFLALLAVLAVPACTCSSSSTPHPPPPVASPEESDGGAASPARPVVLDFVAGMDACAIGHRGVLLDFGDPSMQGGMHPGLVGRGADEVVEHEGATWLRVRSRTVTASFYWPAALEERGDETAYVEARVRGATARDAAVFVDGRPFGTWVLAKGESRVVLGRPPGPPALTAGAHELTLRFLGGPRAGDEPLAEVDWVHVGLGDPGEPYAAPTRRDVLLDAAVGGRSMRALSLRAPGFVRCSGWLPADSLLDMALATTGGGDADLEARMLRDRRPPVILGTAHATGSAVAWTPWTVPLTGIDGPGALASVEVIVRRAGKGTRVLLGEPRVVVAGAPPVEAPPAAQGVVVVVLGSTSARSLAPWGGPSSVPSLAALAQAGTTFSSHRAVSSLAQADLASILTGLPPRVHGVDDPDARLPRGPTTIEEACRQGNVATAMFTANPTTSASFGFERGWDTFAARDPLDPSPATRVFDDAATWIDAHKADRFLVVIHARGGHPPWDASPEEMKTMPPDGYLGMLEPHRAAEALAKVRKHAARFKEDDRARAWALYDHALDTHDAALGRLMAALRAAGRDEDTVVIVTGDVAATEGPVPFIDMDSVDEPLLATPLVIRWPRAPALAGRRVDAPTSPVDLARTVLGALGLAPPKAFQGTDLAHIARAALVPAVRPLAATRGSRFALRWGPFVLVGARDHETRLCDLSLDPACVADVRATTPLALESMHRWAIQALAPVTPAPFPREPAVLDARTSSALTRWGRPSDERELPDEN